jgi:hypothetical protein
MTPKEKAKDLFHKILGKNPNRQDGISIIDTIHAKQCALIAVDEILNQYNSGKFDYKILNEEETDYWNEVKQEIEKL